VRSPKPATIELFQLARKELDEHGLAIAIWRVGRQALEWMLVAPTDQQGNVRDESKVDDKR
jgi:hypothetical protein